MTTLRDILNDFAEEITDSVLKTMSESEEKMDKDLIAEIRDEKVSIIEDYIEVIIRRIVG